MGGSIKDVATYAGTSITAVSWAVNTSERVNVSTLARMQTAMDALHYRSNALGRQLRVRCIGLLSVVLPSLADLVFAECVQGIEEAASITGQRVVLMMTVYDREREARAIETMLEQRVDGLILTMGDIAVSPHPDCLDTEHVPHVLVYNDTVDQVRILTRRYVTADNRATVRDTIRAPLIQGHRQIRMLTSTLTASDRTALRHSGYHEALEVAGIASQPSIEIDFNTDVMLPAELAHLLASPRPTATFYSNDRLTLPITRSLCEMGLRVSEDVSVVGLDDLAMGQWLSPALAAVAQSHRRIGTDATTALTRRIAGEVVPLITLPHRLLVGGMLARAPAEMSLSAVSSLTSDTQGASR